MEFNNKTTIPYRLEVKYDKVNYQNSKQKLTDLLINWQIWDRLPMI